VVSDKRLFILAHAEARRRAAQAVAEAPEGYRVTIGPPLRNLDQNAALWALLGEVAERVVWHGQKLDAAEWKDMFTAALKRQKVVPGLDGGFVVLGSSTSKMTKPEFSDLLEFVNAWAAERPEMQGTSYEQDR
jgi:hypothetical protein